MLFFVIALVVVAIFVAWVMDMIDSRVIWAFVIIACIIISLFWKTSYVKHEYKEINGKQYYCSWDEKVINGERSNYTCVFADGTG